MEEVLNFAVRLDQFARDYDPYEYADSVEDSAENVLITAQMICDGRAEEIRNWLQRAAEETEDRTEDSETAEELLMTLERMERHESTNGETDGETLCSRNRL